MAHHIINFLRFVQSVRLVLVLFHYFQNCKKCTEDGRKRQMGWSKFVNQKISKIGKFIANFFFWILKTIKMLIKKHILNSYLMLNRILETDPQHGLCFSSLSQDIGSILPSIVNLNLVYTGPRVLPAAQHIYLLKSQSLQYPVCVRQPNHLRLLVKNAGSDHRTFPRTASWCHWGRPIRFTWVYCALLLLHRRRICKQTGPGLLRGGKNAGNDALSC